MKIRSQAIDGGRSVTRVIAQCVSGGWQIVWNERWQNIFKMRRRVGRFRHGIGGSDLVALRAACVLIGGFGCIIRSRFGFLFRIADDSILGLFGRVAHFFFASDKSEQLGALAEPLCNALGFFESVIIIGCEIIR